MPCIPIDLYSGEGRLGSALMRLIKEDIQHENMAESS